MHHVIVNAIGTRIAPEARAMLAELGSVTDIEPNAPRTDLLQALPTATILVLQLGFTADKEAIDRAPGLKVIVTATTGTDHIDVSHAKSKGIQVISLMGDTAFLQTITGTAELAAGLMIALTRGIVPAAEEVRNYHWERMHFRGPQLQGKTLGIIGVGRLGTMMAEYGQGFRMRVVGYNNVPITVPGVEMLPLEEVAAQSDVVSIHVPLNDETKGMIDAAFLKRMKKAAYLINTARGAVVNEADVLAALKEERIAGYATDVLADEVNFERSFAHHPLVEYAKTHRNLLITPHIGGMTEESRIATDIFVVKKLKEFLRK